MIAHQTKACRELPRLSKVLVSGVWLLPMAWCKEPSVTGHCAALAAIPLSSVSCIKDLHKVVTTWCSEHTHIGHTQYRHAKVATRHALCKAEVVLLLVVLFRKKYNMTLEPSYLSMTWT